MLWILLLLWLFIIILISSTSLISALFREVEVDKTNLQVIIQRYRDEQGFLYLLWMWISIACWLVLFTIVDFVKLIMRLIKS
jgi:hypothetical protein